MFTELQVQIGRKLARAREAKGLTQVQLAKRVGVTARTIQHYESGKHWPSIATLARLADALDQPLSWFFEA